MAAVLRLVTKTAISVHRDVAQRQSDVCKRQDTNPYLYDVMHYIFVYILRIYKMEYLYIYIYIYTFTFSQKTVISTC